MRSPAGVAVPVGVRWTALGAACWAAFVAPTFLGDGPGHVHAQDGVAGRGLADALRDDTAAQLELHWTTGKGHDLHIADGAATLKSCDEASRCTVLGSPLALSAGQRSQLVSRLRASELFGLHSGEATTTSDRTLLLRHSNRALGSWRLPRADWPTPPDGVGLADYLDDLGRSIEQASQARKPIAVPQTLAALRTLRLQVRIDPHRRPGGQLLLEDGTLRVTPEEGFVPRSPQPRPFERRLSADEEQKLLSLLQQARLDDLDRLVEKREQPAIGDTDGRVLTLHLLPGEKNAADRGQARGIRRYVADLERSPAAPLVRTLVDWLSAPAASSPAPKLHSRR